MTKRILKGYTIIELLVVVSLFVLISVVASSLFFNVMKNSSKTRVMTEVKQNGDFAMTTMIRMIRNAREIVTDLYPCASFPEMASLQIRNPDNGLTTFEFCGASDGDLIASRSANASGHYLTCAEGRLTNDKIRLVSGTGSFSCYEGDELSPAWVEIRFDLTQVGSANLRPEEEAAIHFENTVALRNY